MLHLTVVCPKDADKMANSEDPDQTVPGSALFAQICLSQHFEFYDIGIETSPPSKMQFHFQYFLALKIQIQ